MKNHRKEIQELKQLLKTYEVLETKQIYRYFGDKYYDTIKEMLQYLERNGHICYSPSKTYIALNSFELRNRLDRKRIAAFWTMLCLENVKYHTVYEYRAQIYCIAGEYEYIFIYAANGDETLLNGVYRHHNEKDIRYMVIVEEPEQITKLLIPGAYRFCTVEQNGDIIQYVQEVEV